MHNIMQFNWPYSPHAMLRVCTAYEFAKKANTTPQQCRFVSVDLILLTVLACVCTVPGLHVRRRQHHSTALPPNSVMSDARVCNAQILGLRIFRRRAFMVRSHLINVMQSNMFTAVLCLCSQRFRRGASCLWRLTTRCEFLH